MSVETAVAFGTEQVGQADIALPQYKVKVCLGAVRAKFTDRAESGQCYWYLVVIRLVDNCLRIELGQEKAVVRVPSAATLRRVRSRSDAGRRFKGMHAHSINSLCFKW